MMVLLLAVSLKAQEPPAQALVQGPPSREAFLQEVATRYRAAEWPRGELREGVNLGALVLPGYTGDVVEHAPPGPLQRRFVDKNGEVQFLVEAFVVDQVGEAHQHLVDWLATVSKPGTVPSAAQEGIPVGDVGYVGWARRTERRIAWIAFVRDNVAVRVACLDPSAVPHPDLASVAQVVDGAIAREARVVKGKAVPKPTIQRFAAERQRCRAGDVVPLTVQVDSASGPCSCRFVIDGPGQGYVEQDDRGVWQLHTTGAGSVTLVLQVTSARGTLATATAAVAIAPEK